LPCLAEVGLRPSNLFDTELGARLAGLPRVGLAAVVEHYLKVSLAKEHSEVDWSTRPLPEPWLRYAALDVELLVELREAVAEDLQQQGKLEWARQEFQALTSFTAQPPRPDPWRRISGMHRVRSRRVAALVRELWEVRDRIARERDVSPGRVLPDATLIDLAMRAPRSASALVGVVSAETTRSRQRRAQQALLRHQRQWLAAVAAARLARVRERLTVLSEELRVPVENLLTPDTMRRVLWDPPIDERGEVTEASVDAALAELGARPWQRQLTVPVLTEALVEHP